jgi:hypothetical protein
MNSFVPSLLLLTPPPLGYFLVGQTLPHNTDGWWAIWAALSGEECHLKYDTEPLPNQPFYRIWFFILGVSMIGLSIWGLWLDKL